MSRLHLRGCMGLICGIASLALLGAGPAPASASTPVIDGTTTAVTAAAADPPEVFLVFGGDDTYEDAVLREAAAEGSANARAVVQALRDMVTAGQEVTLDGATPEKAPPAGERLDALAKKLSDLPAKAHIRQDPAVRREAAPGGVGPISPQAINPPDFPQRGYKTAAQWSWEGIPLILEAKLCNPNCRVTDRISTNVNTDPSAVLSRANSNTFYFPDTGAFSHIHIDSWVLCYGTTVCGDDGTGDFHSGPKIWNTASNRNLRGNDIRHGYKLWAYFNRAGYYVTDQAKTGKALCNASDNRCKYIY